jgi:hypothetical protein
VWAKKKNNGYKAVAVTEDHSPNLPEEMERIEKAGELTPFIYFPLTGFTSFY